MTKRCDLINYLRLSEGQSSKYEYWPLYECWRNEDQQEVGNQDYSKQDQHLYTETAAAKVDSQGQGVDIANREWCTGRVKNMSENKSQRKAQK